ncbi:Tryptophan aminotransferase-related protein 4 [Acorus gramineus]|uniref:Tryptophan aminotransferase-related protein 4 n=1 Tax=Acorus gramineus TaxID=55184 RepID=A0AAV9A781_ACOGR|nr:Tryptophan aminotransferase-related protein 4 [Acorus gramineus]
MLGGESKERAIHSSKLLYLLLITSISLNLHSSSVLLLLLPFGSTPEPGWTNPASTEAEAVAAIRCSGHGRAYIDGVHIGGVPVCECNTCYGGSDCSEISPDCPADADRYAGVVCDVSGIRGVMLIRQIIEGDTPLHMTRLSLTVKIRGDPLFLEPYWMREAAGSAVVVAGWHRMSYRMKDNAAAISPELVKQIRRLHSAVGNAITDGRFILFGTGSTHLLNAAVHALSPDDPSSPPAKVLASVPYYPVYEMGTTFFNDRENRWGGTTSTWVNKSDSSTAGEFIEFVTSPNNPDGRLKRPVLNVSSVITDHAYFWPHFTEIPAPGDEDLMVFTLSKLSGHAGSRFGWALVKDKKVYDKMNNYIQLSLFSVSRDTQLRALKLIKVIVEGSKVGGKDIFEFGYSTMNDRWRRLNDVVSKSNRFSLQSLSPQFCTYFQTIRDPSPAYAWLKCEREEDKDCKAALKAEGIISRGGATYNADGRYTRLSLIKTQDDFEQLLQHMVALVSKESGTQVI